MKESINVLSVFNGMSTGHQAFKDLGVKINNYYSSEIKKAALKITAHHFPEIVELGNINNWREWGIDWGSIDVILSGSPCKDLSIAGKRKGINGSNSGLFWVFIEILEHIKKYNPNVIFFQENVGSAPKKDIGIMSRALGVYPVRINSSLLTAQLRDRYYWTNARVRKEGVFNELYTDIPQPKDKNILFKDILESGVVEREKAGCLMQSDTKHLINDEEKQEAYIKKRIAKKRQIPNIVYEDKGILKVKTNTKKGYEEIKEGACINLAFPNSITRRGRIRYHKSACLLEGGEPLYTYQDSKLRTLTKTELCRLQGFPDHYCDILTRNQAASVLGDGWTLPVVKHIFSFFPFKRSL